MADLGAVDIGENSKPGTNHLLSPPRTTPNRRKEKERRNPSITPRKFRRFFTPRSRVSSNPSAARRALHDLAAPALNRLQTPSSPLKPIFEEVRQDDETSPMQAARRFKRQKFHHTPDSSPPGLPSPLDVSPNLLDPNVAVPVLLSPIRSLPAGQSSQELADSEDDEWEVVVPSEPRPIKRIVSFSHRDLATHLVEREVGGRPHAGYQSMSYPVSDWRTETADFFSKPEDVHNCSSQEGGDDARSIPFCTTSCNTNSLVAVGDEEGYVKLFDTASSSKRAFSDVHLAFQVHGNAIIDLAFSEDDYLLATASGDQTGKVVDMMTQTPISLLGHHTASLKQIRFQPGRSQGNVLATSSRDGSVQVWDLRCRGGPTLDIPIERQSFGYQIVKRISHGCVVNSIYDAHARTLRQTKQGPTESVDEPSNFEVPGRNGEVSVTSLQFLPAGREHMLLSACEADASIKLWDIRSIHTSRHKTILPVACTQPPDSHVQWRPFGISSMSLSSDGARLYALCKDNTVYAYSTPHLVLGHAPELSSHADPPRRKHGTAQGLGPLYGFRHPSFHATSFYVKSALRPLREGRSELLAVGSSDSCAVLFPTDEHYLKHEFLRNHQARDEGSTTTIATNNANRPGLFRTNSMTNLSARPVDTIPIVRNGTPLVRGHGREVGAVTWSYDGQLVTASDDYLVRLWRESRAEAADIRRCGETGRRMWWTSGYADIGANWDGDEDDWCDNDGEMA